MRKKAIKEKINLAQTTKILVIYHDLIKILEKKAEKSLSKSAAERLEEMRSSVSIKFEEFNCLAKSYLSKPVTADDILDCFLLGRVAIFFKLRFSAVIGQKEILDQMEDLAMLTPAKALILLASRAEKEGFIQAISDFFIKNKIMEMFQEGTKVDFSDQYSALFLLNKLGCDQLYAYLEAAKDADIKLAYLRSKMTLSMKKNTLSIMNYPYSVCLIFNPWLKESLVDDSSYHRILAAHLASFISSGNSMGLKAVQDNVEFFYAILTKTNLAVLENFYAISQCFFLSSLASHYQKLFFVAINSAKSRGVTISEAVLNQAITHFFANNIAIKGNKEKLEQIFASTKIFYQNILAENDIARQDQVLITASLISLPCNFFAKSPDLNNGQKIHLLAQTLIFISSNLTKEHIDEKVRMVLANQVKENFVQLVELLRVVQNKDNLGNLFDSLTRCFFKDMPELIKHLSSDHQKLLIENFFLSIKHLPTERKLLTYMNMLEILPLIANKVDLVNNVVPTLLGSFKTLNLGDSKIAATFTSRIRHITKEFTKEEYNQAARSIQNLYQRSKLKKVKSLAEVKNPVTKDLALPHATSALRVAKEGQEAILSKKTIEIYECSVKLHTLLDNVLDLGSALEVVDIQRLKAYLLKGQLETVKIIASGLFAEYQIKYESNDLKVENILDCFLLANMASRIKKNNFFNFQQSTLNKIIKMDYNTPQFILFLMSNLDKKQHFTKNLAEFIYKENILHRLQPTLRIQAKTIQSMLILFNKISCDQLFENLSSANLADSSMDSILVPEIHHDTAINLDLFEHDYSIYLLFNPYLKQYLPEDFVKKEILLIKLANFFISREVNKDLGWITANKNLHLMVKKLIAQNIDYLAYNLQEYKCNFLSLLAKYDSELFYFALTSLLEQPISGSSLNAKMLDQAIFYYYGSNIAVKDNKEKLLGIITNTEKFYMFLLSLEFPEDPKAIKQIFELPSKFFLEIRVFANKSKMYLLAKTILFFAENLERADLSERSKILLANAINQNITLFYDAVSKAKDIAQIKKIVGSLIDNLLPRMREIINFTPQNNLAVLIQAICSSLDAFSEEEKLLKYSILLDIIPLIYTRFGINNMAKQILLVNFKSLKLDDSPMKEAVIKKFEDLKLLESKHLAASKIQRVLSSRKQQRQTGLLDAGQLLASNFMVQNRGAVVMEDVFLKNQAIKTIQRSFRAYQRKIEAVDEREDIACLAKATIPAATLLTIPDELIETEKLVESFFNLREGLKTVMKKLTKSELKQAEKRVYIDEVEKLLHGFVRILEANDSFWKFENKEALNVGAFQCFMIGYEIIVSVDYLRGAFNAGDTGSSDSLAFFVEYKKYFFTMFLKHNERVLYLLCCELKPEYQQTLFANYAKLTKKKLAQPHDIVKLLIEYGKYGNTLLDDLSHGFITADGILINAESIRAQQYINSIQSEPSFCLAAQCFDEFSVAELLSNPFFYKYFRINSYNEQDYNIIKEAIFSFYESGVKLGPILFSNFCNYLEMINIQDLHILFKKIPERRNIALLQKIAYDAELGDFYRILHRSIKYTQEISRQSEGEEVLFSAMQILISSLKERCMTEKKNLIEVFFNFLAQNHAQELPLASYKLLVSLNLCAVSSLTQRVELCENYKFGYFHILVKSVSPNQDFLDIIDSEVLVKLDLDKISKLKKDAFLKEFPSYKAKFDAILYKAEDIARADQAASDLLAELADDEGKKKRGKKKTKAKQTTKIVAEQEAQRKLEKAAEKAAKKEVEEAAKKEAKKLAALKEEARKSELQAVEAARKEAKIAAAEEAKQRKVREKSELKQHKKLQKNAVTKIQAVIRGKLVRDQLSRDIEIRQESSATKIQELVRKGLKKEGLSRRDFLAEFTTNTSDPKLVLLPDEIQLFFKKILPLLHNLGINASIKGSALYHPYSDIDLEANFILSESEYKHLLESFKSRQIASGGGIFADISKYYNKGLVDLLHYVSLHNPKTGTVKGINAHLWLQFTIGDLDFSFYFLNKTITYDRSPSSGVVDKQKLLGTLLYKHQFSELSDEIAKSEIGKMISRVKNEDNCFVACYNEPKPLESKIAQLNEIKTDYKDCLTMCEELNLSEAKSVFTQHKTPMKLDSASATARSLFADGGAEERSTIYSEKHKEIESGFAKINQEFARLKENSLGDLASPYAELKAQLSRRIHTLEKLEKLMQNDLSLITPRLKMADGELLVSAQKSVFAQPKYQDRIEGYAALGY